MQHQLIQELPHHYRRRGISQRAMTLAPVVESQDACRYQAKDAPRPVFDLAREKERDVAKTLLAPAIVLAMTAAGVAIVQAIGNWLAR